MMSSICSVPTDTRIKSYCRQHKVPKCDLSYLGDTAVNAFLVTQLLMGRRPRVYDPG